MMLCIASARCVELENICSSDSFIYKTSWSEDPGILVNAFHKVQKNITFQPIGHYLINDTVKCDFFEFKNKTNFWEALKIKHK